MKGGSARPVVPFLKRSGFIASDGSPTELYRRFRNQSQAGAAAADATRKAFAPLYEVNEYVHLADDPELKGIVMQVTGWEETSPTLRAAVGSFKALKDFADFEAELGEEPAVELRAGEADGGMRTPTPGPAPAAPHLNLGYTINLQLPATSDVAVFNAIFKSLRDNLLG